jgi:hypothetical protein
VPFAHAKVGYRQAIFSKQRTPGSQECRGFFVGGCSHRQGFRKIGAWLATRQARAAPLSGADAVCATADAAQGLALLQSLDDEAVLADVARNAKLWEVRLAAAQRVTDSVLLERIAEATKHRDDRVY